MVNHHRKSFFGSKTGIIFDSNPSSSPDIFLTFIKKKEDGSWEKPSQKEGRTIKLSLVDVAFMLRVLRGEKDAWETFHSYDGRDTPILFERDSKDRERLKVKAGDYLKLLNYGEVEVFKALLTHVFQEKIIASTEAKKREDHSGAALKKEPNRITVEETSEEKIESVVEETAELSGVCEAKTEKALLIAFEGKKAIWVPKSVILSDYDSDSKTAQNFEVDTWILKKNNLM